MIHFFAGLLLGLALGGACFFYALKRRDQLLGNFFAFAMHEINTPLTAINMTVLNFLSGIFGPVQADQTRWLEMMRTQTSRLNGIVGELRDMVHFELKGDLAIRTEAVSLSDAVETALSALRNGVPASEFSIDVRMPEALPKVEADGDRLSRTISSLLFHARKFKASGPVALEAVENGTRVLVTVSYQGAKIAPEEASRSLDVFYPAYRRKNQLLSTIGAGLGTLRRLARMQGGDLTLAVAPDGQSVLCLALRKMV